MTATIERSGRRTCPAAWYRGRRWSIRVDPRSVAVGAMLAIAIVVVGCWSISVGDFPISISEVVKSLFGEGSKEAEFIVGTLRLPAGAHRRDGRRRGRQCPGAIFQSLAQNPLASPDIVGFNSGAALGAVFMIVVVGAGSLEVSIGAVLGGLVAATIVYLLAYKNGVQGYRLILVGIGIGFAMTAVSDYLITRANIYDVQRAAVWLTGRSTAAVGTMFAPSGIGLLVLMPIALAYCRSLRLLELGPDTAAALGVRVGRARLILILVGIGLAALATASAGPVGFVALVSPPVARRMVRSPASR